METAKPINTNHDDKEAVQFLAKLQALQEVNLELARIATLEDLYHAAIELGRTRLGFDRLGLLLYDETANMMIGTFGTDTLGEIRDERDFRQTVNEELLDILSGQEKLGFWENTELHDEGQVVDIGWNAMAVLWSGEKGVGWLAADNHLKHIPLEQRQLDILQLYAINLGHLVLARQIEQQQAELLKLRANQVEISTQVAQAIASTTNLEDLYKQIVTEIKDRFGYYHTQLLRYNSDIDVIELIAGYGDIGAKMLANKHQIPMGQGIIGTAAATGESILRSDITGDTDWSSNPLLPETKGEIAVPIKLDKEILGVLDIQSDTINALGRNDQLLLEGLCGQIAVAINSTRLNEERLQAQEALNQSQETLKTTLERRQKLHDISLELASIQDLEELYKQAIIKGCKQLGFDRLGLYLIDLEAENMTGTFGINKDGKLQELKDDVFYFHEGDWVKNFVFNQDRLILEEDTDLWEKQEKIGHGWNAISALWIRETPIGVFFADNLISQEPLPPHLPELLAAYSTDVANLINRLRAEEALQKSQETLRATLERQQELHDISLELSSIQDLDELYKQVIIKARERLGFDRIGLFLVDLGVEELRGTYGINPKGELISIKHDIFNFSDGNWVKRIVYSQERIFVREDTDLLEGQEVIGRGWHLTATMKIRDNLIGVMFADNMVSHQPFHPHFPELFSAYSTDAANLIDRLHSEHLLREREQTIQEFLEKQQALHEVGLNLSRIEDSEDLYKEAIILGQTSLGFDRLGLYLIDSEHKTVHGTFGIDVDGKLRNEYHLVHVLDDEPWMHRFIYDNERLSISEDSDLYEDVEIVGHGWSVTAALWSQGKPIGLLFADNLLNQQPLQPYQPELLAAYGATIANLVVHAGEAAAREELRKNTEKQADDLAQVATNLQTVADLSTQITSIQDPQKLMEMIVQETQARFGLYHCHIFLIDETGKNLSIRACGWHLDAPQYGTHGNSTIPLASKQSLVAQAARTRQAVIINDVHNDPNWLPNELLPDTRSEMAVPLIVGETVLGVLDVQSAELDRFGSADIKIQTTLAAQIAVALENAHSLERSKEVVAELDALTRRLTRESWEAYVTDLEKYETDIVYSFGELAEVSDEMDSKSANGQHSKHLMVRGESIGQLTIFDEAETEQLDTDTALIIAAVADQLSARVENIRLTEQTQQALAQTQIQAERLGLLNEISAEMSNVDTLDQVFDIIFARIPDLLKVDRVSMAMLRPDGEHIEIIGFKGDDMNAPTGTIIPLAGTSMNQALQENRIIVNNNLSSENNIKSSMTAPILSAGRAIGTLNIGSMKANSMTEQDETLLQQLATMLSSVVENKQLLAAAQARAERERQVRTITDRIRRGVDREAILNIAQKEISQLIGAKQSTAQLGTKAQLLERIQHSIEQTKHDSD